MPCRAGRTIICGSRILTRYEMPMPRYFPTSLAVRSGHSRLPVVGENVELGVEVRIEKPSEAGADRLTAQTEIANLDAQIDQQQARIE